MKVQFQTMGRRRLIRSCITALLLVPAVGRQAIGSPREDILRILVRLKSSIENGVSFLRFLQLIQELDEAVQMAEVTKSHDTSATELQTAKVLLLYLARVGQIWRIINRATHCHEMYTARYLLNHDCSLYIKPRLAELDTSLEKLGINGASAQPQEIIGPLLANAKKSTVDLIEILAKSR